MATFAPTRTTMYPPVRQTAAATHVNMVSAAMALPPKMDTPLIRKHRADIVL